MPPSIVTSEQVTQGTRHESRLCACFLHVFSGKPFPHPYLEGAKRCNVDPTTALVVEDAPSGIRSGKAAGAKTLAVLTSHSREEMLQSGAGPDYIAKDLTS